MKVKDRLIVIQHHRRSLNFSNHFTIKQKNFNITIKSGKSLLGSKILFIDSKLEKFYQSQKYNY